MPRPVTFRDYNMEDEDQYQYWGKSQGLRPFWAVVNDRSIADSERELAILKLKNDVIESLLDWREPITRVQRLNNRLYQGRYYMSEADFYSRPYNQSKRFSKNNARIVVPYLFTATEQHVADLSSFEPALTVMPTKNEEVAKVAAKACNDVIKHYFHEHELTARFQRFHRRKKIEGETFMFQLWNPDAGDLSPAYKKLREMQKGQGTDSEQPIPLIDPNTGEPIEGDGGPLFIEKPVRTGDLMMVAERSERVLYPIPDTFLWEDVPYVIRCPVWMDVDEAKARWPHVADKIRAEHMFERFTTMRAPALTDKVAIRYLYHPRTVFMDRGYYCVSTESTVLESGPYPFDHNKLPCIRGTDIDIEGEVTGMSFFQLLASLSYAINDSTSMILQNQELFARPKIQVPRGAKIRRLDLDDDRGMYEYSGPKGAELIAVNSTPPDTWKWRDAMRDEFQTHSAIFATSRGRGVDGITANVALRLIDEQERKMHKPAIDKHSQNCVDLGAQILSLLGTYRDPSDGMLIKILGKNNERYLKAFDIANLNAAYEVRLAKSSALPQSPAAKSQLVLDYANQFPDLWSPEEILEQLDMPRPERLVESATLARQTAEAEVEDILQGYDVPPPTQYHDILPKYKVYVKAMQNRSFDSKPPPIKNRLINMVVTAEYLIMKRFPLNPALQATVMQQHPYFPLFFPMPKGEVQQYQLAVGAPPAQGMLPGPGAPMGTPNAPDLAGMDPAMKNGAPVPPAQGAPPEPPVSPEGQAVPPPGSMPPQQDIPPSPTSLA